MRGPAPETPVASPAAAVVGRSNRSTSAAPTNRPTLVNNARDPCAAARCEGLAYADEHDERSGAPSIDARPIPTGMAVM